MRRTRFGRHIAAIGSNEQVARYSAIKVDRVRLMTYVLQGLLVGIAAVLYVPKFGSANSSTAVLWELQAIAAVIIGGTTLKGGFGPHLGHGGRRHHPRADRQHPQSAELDQPLSQPGVPGRHHHHRRAAAAHPPQRRTRSSVLCSARKRASMGGRYDEFLQDHRACGHCGRRLRACRGGDRPGQDLYHRRLGADRRPRLDRRRRLLRPAGRRPAEQGLPEPQVRAGHGAGFDQAGRRPRGHGDHPQYRRASSSCRAIRTR